MDMQTETTSKRSVRGRKDSNGQVAVIHLETLNVRVADLVEQKQLLDAGSAAYGEAVKATAEEAGLNPATVRKFIAAKAGNDFEKNKSSVLQMALVFEQAEA